MTDTNRGLGVRCVWLRSIKISPKPTRRFTIPDSKLMPTPTIIEPSREDIKRFIKSELGRIQAKDYTLEDIFQCVRAYTNRAGAIQKKIDSFSLQVQSAPGISRYVHSVRTRLKDPYHLADKLVRKCLDSKASRNVTKDVLFDPQKGIHDLGGVRILHLRRKEWKEIHKYFVDPASMEAVQIHEKKAYVKPDQKRYYVGEGLFSDREIGYDEDKKYTSLHYVFRTPDDIHGTIYFECQVRTLFEEGWGEIDHEVNYPEKANAIVGGYLSSLNDSAHTANEIASKLETLKHIPLFVTWASELRLERSADRVYCVTPDLLWVANNLDSFIQHVRDSNGMFEYFVLKSDGVTDQNCTTVTERLAAEDLLNKRVSIHRVPPEKSVVPVIADLLLLENASDPISRMERPMSVVGAPAQCEVTQEEHLDMVITDESAVQRMREFFGKLR